MFSKALIFSSCVILSVSALEINLNRYCPSTNSIERCARDVYDRSENSSIALTKTYREVMASENISDKHKEMLRTSQFNWIKFHDTYCDFLINVKDASDLDIYNIVRHTCEADLKDRQIERLKALL